MNKRRLLYLLPVVLVLILSFWLYRWRWLSSQERGAAWKAIYAVDAMDATDNRDSVFAQREQRARSLIAECHIRASTERDKHVAFLVEMYFGAKEIAHSEKLVDGETAVAAKALFDVSQSEEKIGVHFRGEALQEIE